jgi:SAM-dependent methyltransferase
LAEITGTLGGGLMLNPFAVKPVTGAVGAAQKVDTTVEQLAKMINGHRFSASVCAAARLKVADQLAAGPVAIEELARRTGTDAHSLYRLLRALASLGIFEETAARTFQNTDASQLLRSDAEPSLYGLACMTAMMHHFAYPEILYSLRTGKTAFEKVFAAGFFDYMKTHPEEADAFDRAMAGYTEVVAEAVVGVYDFSRYRHIVDIGGGAGAFLSKIARKHPEVRGTVFDLDHVVARTAERLRSAGLSDRVGVAAGSFFEAIPEGGDLYTIKIVLCDWGDDDVKRILSNVRRVVGGHKRLLIIDAIIPPGNAPSFAKFSDINMMLITGGRERTEEDFRRLLAATGFEVTSVSTVHEWVGLVEAMAA